MTAYLNQILYNNKKFDSHEAIASLEAFMYKAEPTKIEEPIYEPINENVGNEIPAISESSVFTVPRNEDTLFWCMYIAKYGYGDYLAIGTKYKNKEIEKKQEMIDTIKKSPAIMKCDSYKLSKVAVQEILADLLVNKKTTMNTLLAMCILYNLRVYVIDESVKTYVHYRANETTTTTETFIIRKTIDGFYGVDMDTNTAKIATIEETRLAIEPGPKPIKGMSAYKVGELETMIKKLGVWPNDGNKRTKTDLYDILQKTLSFA